MSSLRSIGSALGVVITACSGGALAEGGGNVIEPEPRVAIAPDGIEVLIGDTIRMRAWALPPRDVAAWQWSVSPKDRATVDQEGRLAPTAVGEVEVRACANVPERICGSAPLSVRSGFLR